MLAEGFVVLAVVLTPCASASRPMLAEVLYDAVGDDTGHEFVELFNPTSAPVSLAGLRLEAGDGAGPGRWTLRWTGQAADTIAAFARFVVGGSLVLPPPQATAALDLQNGPDAVRLAWPDGTIETLGYGALTGSEYFCGSPAPDVPSGQSLARIPDDSNAGGNAIDFRPSIPSPGRANLPSRDIAWIPGSISIVPEQPGIGEIARIGGAITNRGSSAIASGELRLDVTSIGSSGQSDLASPPLPIAIAPAESARIEVELGTLPEGKYTLSCRLDLAEDEAPENDRDSLRVRFGPGPLEITEIQFHPAHGEGEWVEVRARGNEAVDPMSFTLSDRGAARGVPGEGDEACEPESLALFAQDRAALLAAYPRLDPRRVWQVSPWSSLNNADDSNGVADLVVIRETDGAPCAREAYSAAGVPAGVPIERIAGGGWRISPDPDGTPLLPPRPPLAVAKRFELSPRRTRTGAGPAQVAWSLPWPRARVAVELYDMAGTRVARPMPETAVAGSGEREWSIGGIAPGLYLVVLRARAESGGESLSESRVLRVDGVEP